MDLKRVRIVFILVLMGFAGMASSLCLVRNSLMSKVYLYQCSMSDNYLEDVNKAPIDIQKLTFSSSRVKVVRNRSFARLGKNLERLEFFHCDVEEIEDHAFEGLTKLDLLAFVGNKLRVIKSAWFEGLSNLKIVSFHSNQIQYVEDNFFSILPPLKALDISVNEITCLPTASFGNFYARDFRFRVNRLTWMCQVLLVNRLKNTNISSDLNYTTDAPYDLTEMCIEKLPRTNLNENSLNECIGKTTRELLPEKGDYTVKEICEFLKDAPSPFLDCPK